MQQNDWAAFCEQLKAADSTMMGIVRQRVLVRPNDKPASVTTQRLKNSALFPGRYSGWPLF